MTNTRTTTLTLLTLMLLAALATADPVLAGQRPGQQDGAAARSAVAQLPQDKKDLLRTILTAHRKEVQPLRDSMWEKRTLLHALSTNPNTTPDTIKALVKEMADLRIKLRESHEALEAKVLKEVGIQLPHRPAFGRGMHRGGQGMRSGLDENVGQFRGASCPMEPDEDVDAGMEI